MPEGAARLRRWPGVLCLGSVLALAACAPMPVTESGAVGAGTGAACKSEGGAEGCPTETPSASSGPVRETTRAPQRPRPRPVPPVVAPEPAQRTDPEPTLTEPPRESDQQGLASWYGPGLHGRRTASGERFDRYELTAAHRTLPFGSRVCVRSAVTGKTVVVRINDRGPFTGGRVIDLSEGAAQELGMTGLGIKPVELWLMGSDEETCPDALQESAVSERDAGAFDGVGQVVRRPAPARTPPLRNAKRSRQRSK